MHSCLLAAFCAWPFRLHMQSKNRRTLHNPLLTSFLSQPNTHIFTMHSRERCATHMHRRHARRRVSDLSNVRLFPTHPMASYIVRIRCQTEHVHITRRFLKTRLDKFSFLRPHHPHYWCSKNKAVAQLPPYSSNNMPWLVRFLSNFSAT